MLQISKKKKIAEIVKPPPKRKPQEEDIEEAEMPKKVKPSSAPVYPSKIKPSKTPIKPSRAPVRPSRAIEDETGQQSFERKFVKNKFIKPRTVPIPRSIPSGDADHEFMPQALALATRGTKMIGSMASSLRQAAQEKMAGVASSAAETGKKALFSTTTG